MLIDSNTTKTHRLLSIVKVSEDAYFRVDSNIGTSPYARPGKRGRQAEEGVLL